MKLNGFATFLIAGVLLLAGCASVSYQDVTEGPRARVRFVNGGQLAVRLKQKGDGRDIDMMTLVNHSLGSLTGHRGRLGIPLWHFEDSAAQEVYVSSRERFRGVFHAETGSISGNNITWRCDVNFAFDFLPDETYEVVFDHEENTCRVDIFRIVSRNGKPVRLRERLTAEESKGE